MASTNNVKKKKKNPWILRGILFFWFILLGGLISIVAILYGTSKGMLGPLPDVQELENPEINVASEIYSSDGKLIDKFEKEKRIPVTYHDLPPHLVKALLAREDVRFIEHSGIDGESIMRAVASGGKDGGGSTITQQLAKQLFTQKVSSNKIERVKQKLKEWVVALQLERLYTKEEIITMYLNKFDFIYRANGIEAAAQTYFQKHTKELSVPESAVLISMLKSPVLYNPKSNPEGSLHERNVVLSQMFKYGFITRNEFERYKNEPLGLNFKMLESSVQETYSAYFKYAMRVELQEYFKQYEKEHGIHYDLYRDGLKIYTSIDSRMQKMGEDAIKQHLKSVQKMFFAEQRGNPKAPFYNISSEKRQRIFEAAMRRTIMYKNRKNAGMTDEEILAEFNKPRDSVQFFTWEGKKYEKNKSWMDSIIYHKHIIEAGLMSMDPKDGTIKAWVGGVDWDYFKFDHVKQARRQVGSTFKPFVYATAIHQMNYPPCHMVSNEPFSSGTWRPKNASGRYGGSLSLRDGLAHSVNVISARLIAESRPQAVIQLAKDLGIKSPIPNNLTIALGSADLTLYEMVGAMSTFADSGIYIKPEIILSIEDKTGKIIKDYEPETREVLNEDVAYTMIDLMKGVVDRGTGKSIRNYGISAEVAGKTGTTNEGSDSWFIGLTPNLVTGVWVGNEDRFAHFRGWQSQGAKMALPIWAYYMKKVYSDGTNLGVTQSDKFEKPEGIEKKWDCNSQGFYNFGNMGSMHDNRTGARQHGEREQSVNEILSSDNDTISFD
ncbi:peptidoglycan glycosyltransferase [Ornithobacterium rhinotracheale]|uniref:penicillin-binding protein 1A n=1 Tax=Ornithobacterium rhinotracheale TaxID=28251 RepID=UPI00129C27E5|nr:transglycosylase domain-containing protein [Ornithobacterium rhinotracheale]MRJ09646.1 peptidoglycan glycosyltransferase [Ornithobacterium rhinotracheale]